MVAVKHFVWIDYADGEPPVSGRVAVRIDGDEIQFSHINGKAPYAKMHAWKEALEKAFPEVFEGDRWEREHLQLPWRVETYVGWSGRRTYELRELVNEGLRDAPVRGRIDVSMFNKLRDFRMKIGHFKALLRHILQETEDARGSFYVVERIPKVYPSWNPPYDESEENE